MENESHHFEFIIVGAGAAGLMLADALSKDAFFQGKSILLLDKDTKQTNDRTWCFWEKGKGKFDAIVSKTWGHVYFAGQNFTKRFPIAPYSYKMIKGIDFYTSYLKELLSQPNVSFSQEEVLKVQDRGNQVSVTTNKNKYTANKAFNSIFDFKVATSQEKYPVLRQHFVGWFIKTDIPIFDPDQATYMDFSIAQKGNTRFMYVLPFSKTEALVEYTLFSKELLPKKEYEEAIKTYITENLNCKNYTIVDKEQGSIPMTCYDFSQHNTSNIYNIGTAGGWAKPSTGYTFMSTSKKVPKLIAHLKTGKPLKELKFKNRFWYYDLLLLDVLDHDNKNGSQVFEQLFKNREPQLIFKFLDENTSFIEDVRFIMGCPKMPFIKAFNRVFL